MGPLSTEMRDRRESRPFLPAALGLVDSPDAKEKCKAVTTSVNPRDRLIDTNVFVLSKSLFS